MKNKGGVKMLHPRKLVMIRHPHSEGNLLSDQGMKPDLLLGKGSHLFELSPQGKNQLDRAAQNIKRFFPEPFDVHYVSEYQRARIMHKKLFPGVKPIINEQLNEMDRGIWWLYEKEYIKDRYPDEYLMNELKGRAQHKHMGGEGVAQMRGRIRNFLMWASMYHSEESVVLSGHGSWMKAAWCIISGEKYPSWDVHNCEAFVYEANKSGKGLLFKDRIKLAD
jgi:broad specificity phosphatase PhoE